MKYIARAILALLAIAILVTLAVVRTDLTMPIPLFGQDDVPVLALLVWGLFLIAALIAAFCVLVALWEIAFPKP